MARGIEIPVVIVQHIRAVEAAVGARRELGDLEAVRASRETRNLDVIQATSAADGMAVITSDAAIHAVLMDWTLDDDNAKTHEKAQGLRAFAVKQGL